MFRGGGDRDADLVAETMSLVILQLTAPNGAPVWVAPAIFKMMPSQDHPGGSLLWTAAGTQEVEESPEKILRMIDNTGMKLRALHGKMKRAMRKPKNKQLSIFSNKLMITRQQLQKRYP
jgi:hypothetical protein